MGAKKTATWKPTRNRQQEYATGMRFLRTEEENGERVLCISGGKKLSALLKMVKDSEREE